MSYNNENVFRKILDGKLPAEFVHKTDYTVAFRDVYPNKKIHVLVIPKGEYSDFYAFETKASEIERLDFWRCVKETIDILELRVDGFRLITNCGEHGNQTVFHFHMHVLGGENVGRLTE